jgi:DTW domain-containing protein YfiP
MTWGAKMSKISESIEELILLNVKIWHEATKVKDISGQLYDKPKLPLEDRVACALEIRRLNAKRSAVRWEIDKAIGSGTNETKIFSKE